MRAMVFAAGLGTRLMPLTSVLPKPVLPLANRPMSWFILDYLERHGVSEVLMNTHFLAKRLYEQIEQWIPPSIQLSFVYEPVLLGTGGGLRNAWKPVDGEPLIVLNSDILFAPNLSKALKVHSQMKAVATLVLREVPNPDAYGSIEVDGFGRVRRIVGFPKNMPGPLHKYMFTGVQILHSRAFSSLPKTGCIIRSAYRMWLDRGEVIAYVVDNSPWFDLGTLDSYLDANCCLASGRIQWGGINSERNCIIDSTSCIGKDTFLDQVVAGARVRIGSGIRLKRVTLWKGATVASSLQDAIVTGTPAGTVTVERGAV